MSVFELWLPIVIGGFLVHVASFLAWVVLPHHKPEWRKLDAEDDLIDLIDSKNIPTGQYIFPFAMGPEAETEEHKQKAAKCRGMLVLWPHVPSMGVNISLTLAYFLAVTFVIGYLASLALAPGAKAMDVFQVAFTAAFLTHVAGGLQQVIWFRRKVLMEVLDGLAYSIITGLAFALMWPGAA